MGWPKKKYGQTPVCTNVAVCGLPRCYNGQTLEQGVGKTWLADRLLLPQRDEFAGQCPASPSLAAGSTASDAHTSVIDHARFVSAAINGDHFIYHGCRSVATPSAAKSRDAGLELRVIEHTAFVNAAKSPFPSKMKYTDRATSRRVVSIGNNEKLSYLSNRHLTVSSDGATASASATAEHRDAFPQPFKVNVYILVYDATLQLGQQEQQWRLLTEIVVDLKSSASVVFVISKCDALQAHEIDTAQRNVRKLLQDAGVRARASAPVVPVSAKDNIGMDRLLNFLVHLSNGPLCPPPVEVPYATAVKESQDRIDDAVRRMEVRMRAELAPNTAANTFDTYFKMRDDKVALVVDLIGESATREKFRSCLKGMRATTNDPVYQELDLPQRPAQLSTPPALPSSPRLTSPTSPLPTIPPRLSRYGRKRHSLPSFNRRTAPAVEAPPQTPIRRGDSSRNSLQRQDAMSRGRVKSDPSLPKLSHGFDLTPRLLSSTSSSPSPPGLDRTGHPAACYAPSGLCYQEHYSSSPYLLATDRQRPIPASTKVIKGAAATATSPKRQPTGTRTKKKELARLQLDLCPETPPKRDQSPASQSAPIGRSGSWSSHSQEDLVFFTLVEHGPVQKRQPRVSYENAIVRSPNRAGLRGGYEEYEDAGTGKEHELAMFVGPALERGMSLLAMETPGVPQSNATSCSSPSHQEKPFFSPPPPPCLPSRSPAHLHPSPVSGGPAAAAEQERSHDDAMEGESGVGQREECSPVREMQSQVLLLPSLRPSPERTQTAGRQLSQEEFLKQLQSLCQGEGHMPPDDYVTMHKDGQ